jgi:hypothetical protein
LGLAIFLVFVSCGSLGATVAPKKWRYCWVLALTLSNEKRATVTQYTMKIVLSAGT